MAERTITLTLSPREEKALSHLLGAACTALSDDEPNRLTVVAQQAGPEALGKVNLALNGTR